MEKILSMIGLAHKAGRVEIGEEPVGSAARAKKARIILVAGDAAASSVRRAMGFANTGSCLCLVIPASKEELEGPWGAQAALWRPLRTWALPTPLPKSWRRWTRSALEAPPSVWL